MSGGLFGRTEYEPTTNNYQGAISSSTGGNFNKLTKLEGEANYEETKDINDKYGYLLQPNYIFKNNPLNAFRINSVARDIHLANSLNASYYNGLSDNKKDFVYQRELYIPKALPNHSYNPYKNAPVLSGITEPAYPI